MSDITFVNPDGSEFKGPDTVENRHFAKEKGLAVKDTIGHGIAEGARAYEETIGDIATTAQKALHIQKPLESVLGDSAKYVNPAAPAQRLVKAIADIGGSRTSKDVRAEEAKSLTFVNPDGSKFSGPNTPENIKFATDNGLKIESPEESSILNDGVRGAVSTHFQGVAAAATGGATEMLATPEERAIHRAQVANNPYAHITGTVGGIVGTMAPMSAIAGAATKLAGLSTATSIGQKVLQGAIEGATYSAPNAAAELIINKNPTAAAENLALGIGLGAVLNPILPAVGSAVKKSSEYISETLSPIRKSLDKVGTNMLLDSTGLSPAAKADIGFGTVEQKAAEQKRIVDILDEEGVFKHNDPVERAKAIIKLTDENGPKLGDLRKQMDEELSNLLKKDNTSKLEAYQAPKTEKFDTTANFQPNSVEPNTIREGAPTTLRSNGLKEELDKQTISQRTRAGEDQLFAKEGIQNQAAEEAAALKDFQGPSTIKDFAAKENARLNDSLTDATKTIGFDYRKLLREVNQLKSADVNGISNETAINTIMKKIENIGIKRQNAEGTLSMTDGSNLKTMLQNEGSYTSEPKLNLQLIKKKIAGLARQEEDLAFDRISTLSGKPKLIDDYKKYKDLYGISRQLSDAAEKMINESTVKNMDKALSAISLHHIGIGGIIGHLLMPGVGGLAGTLAGAAAGTTYKLIGNYLRPKAPTMIGNFLRKSADSPYLGSFLAMDSAAIVDKKISSIAGMLGSKSISAKNVNFASLRLAHQEGRSEGLYEKDYKKISDSLIANAATPSAFNAHVNEVVAPLRTHHNDVADALVEDLQRKQEYLYRILPKNPNQTHVPFSKEKDWKPTAAQEQEFFQNFKIAEDPFSVIEDIKSGKLTAKQVGTLAYLNPEIFSKIREEMYKIGSEKKVNLTHQQKLSAALLLGEDLGTGMNIIKPIQASYATVGAAPQSPGPAHKVDMSGSMTTSQVNQRHHK